MGWIREQRSRLLFRDEFKRDNIWQHLLRCPSYRKKEKLEINKSSSSVATKLYVAATNTMLGTWVKRTILKNREKVSSRCDKSSARFLRDINSIFNRASTISRETNRRCAREILTDDKNSKERRVDQVDWNRFKHRLNRSQTRACTYAQIATLGTRVSLHLDQELKFE